jgi:retinoblastoma-like protein 1
VYVQRALLARVLWRSAACDKSGRVLSRCSETSAPVPTPLRLAAPVLSGLVSDTERMGRVSSALEREYEAASGRAGFELDERDFLVTDFSKFASPRFSPGAMHTALNKLRGGPVGVGGLAGLSGMLPGGPLLGMGALPVPLRGSGLLGPGAHTTTPGLGLGPGLLSPLPLMGLMGPGQPGTPVTELLGSSAWLRATTASLAAEVGKAGRQGGARWGLKRGCAVG